MRDFNRRLAADAAQSDTKTPQGGINLLHFRSLRALSAVAVAGAMTLGGFSFARPAGAATLISCRSWTQRSGNQNWQIGGCTGNTGGASMGQFDNVLTTNPLSVIWANGKVTTVSWTSSTTETDHDLACPAGHPTEYQFKGTVTADTSGSAPVGGTATAEICYIASFNVSFRLEPGTLLRFR